MYINSSFIVEARQPAPAPREQHTTHTSSKTCYFATLLPIKKTIVAGAAPNLYRPKFLYNTKAQVLLLLYILLRIRDKFWVYVYITIN